MCVLIEGVDLSGKSSVVKLLSSGSRKWQTRHSSLLDRANPLYEIARSISNKGMGGTDGRKCTGYLYSSVLAYDLEMFVHPTVDTVQDSTILLRSLAFHDAAGDHAVVKTLEQYACRHTRFDSVFVLTASLDERKRRLRKRINNSEGRVTVNDQLLYTNPEFFARMEECLIKHAYAVFDNVVTIDTSNKDIECVMNEMNL